MLRGIRTAGPFLLRMQTAGNRERLHLTTNPPRIILACTYLALSPDGSRVRPALLCKVPQYLNRSLVARFPSTGR